MTAADWRSALVGMQPRRRQVPPSRSSRSTSATRFSSWAARSAQEYPPVPAPTTITSNASAIGSGPFVSAGWDGSVILPPRGIPVDADLRQTPLQDEHEALGAKLGEFAGWAMPIEYAGVLTEHRAVREAVGMFDLTHLGKVDVEGPGAGAWLQRVVTSDLSTFDIGGAQYGMV